MLKILLFAHQLMDRYLGCVHTLALVNNNTVKHGFPVFRVDFRSVFVDQSIHVNYMSSYTAAQLSQFFITLAESPL